MTFRALLIALAFVLAGCCTIGNRSTERLRSATLPAAASSVNATTDTIVVEALPPAVVRGVPTEPLRVTRYDSTDGPPADVRRVTYTPGGTFDILLQSGVQLEYEPPAYGESFDWIARSDTSGAAQVRGEPEEREVEVAVEEEGRTWWDWARDGLAFIGLLVILAFAARRVI